MLDTEYIIKEMVKESLATMCNLCTFTDKCPYCGFNETKFCFASKERIMSYLRRFSVTEDDRKNITRNLSFLTNPTGLLRSMSMWLLLENIVRLDVAKIMRSKDTVKVSDIVNAYKIIIKVLQKARHEICFLSLSGWWASQEPYCSILSEDRKQSESECDSRT